MAMGGLGGQVLGHLALLVTALFTGAAVYINVVEQPARLMLDPAGQVRQWKPAYRRGFAMQASLALLGGVLAVAAFFATRDWSFLAGAVLLLGTWPFTLIGIMPTNQQLLATAEADAGPVSVRLIENWGQLHMVRSGLGAVATAVFFWATLT